MGPLFNGATIAAERSVWAAGDAAKRYNNSLPAEGGADASAIFPQNGDSCPDDGEDDSGPTLPTTDQKSQMATTNNKTNNQTTEEQKTLDSVIKFLTDNKGTIEDVESFASGVGKILGDVKFIQDIIDKNPELGLKGLAIKVLIGIAEKILKSEVVKDIENALKDDIDKLEDAIKSEIETAVKSKLKDAGYTIVAASPNPATKDCSIAHGPEEQFLAEMILATAAGVTIGNYAKAQGTITEGSPNVFFGKKAVARVNHTAHCDLHAGPHVAEGSKTVFANGWPIPRVGHKLTCNAIASEGVSSICIDCTTSSAFKLAVNVGTNQRVLDLTAILLELNPGAYGKEDSGTQTSPTSPSPPSADPTSCGCDP